LRGHFEIGERDGKMKIKRDGKDGRKHPRNIFLARALCGAALWWLP